MIIQTEIQESFPRRLTNCSLFPYLGDSDTIFNNIGNVNGMEEEEEPGAFGQDRLTLGNQGGGDQDNFSDLSTIPEGHVEASAHQRMVEANERRVEEAMRRDESFRNDVTGQGQGTFTASSLPRRSVRNGDGMMMQWQNPLQIMAQFPPRHVVDQTEVIDLGGDDYEEVDTESDLLSGVEVPSRELEERLVGVHGESLRNIQDYFNKTQRTTFAGKEELEGGGLVETLRQKIVEDLGKGSLMRMLVMSDRNQVAAEIGRVEVIMGGAEYTVAALEKLRQTYGEQDGQSGFHPTAMLPVVRRLLSLFIKLEDEVVEMIDHGNFFAIKCELDNLEDRLLTLNKGGKLKRGDTVLPQGRERVVLFRWVQTMVVTLEEMMRAKQVYEHSMEMLRGPLLRHPVMEENRREEGRTIRDSETEMKGKLVKTSEDERYWRETKRSWRLRRGSEMDPLGFVALFMRDRRQREEEASRFHLAQNGHPEEGVEQQPRLRSSHPLKGQGQLGGLRDVGHHPEFDGLMGGRHHPEFDGLRNLRGGGLATALHGHPEEGVEQQLRLRSSHPMTGQGQPSEFGVFKLQQQKYREEMAIQGEVDAWAGKGRRPVKMEDEEEEGSVMTVMTTNSEQLSFDMKKRLIDMVERYLEKVGRQSRQLLNAIVEPNQNLFMWRLLSKAGSESTLASKFPRIAITWSSEFLFNWRKFFRKVDTSCDIHGLSCRQRVVFFVHTGGLKQRADDKVRPALLIWLGNIHKRLALDMNTEPETSLVYWAEKWVQVKMDVILHFWRNPNEQTIEDDIDKLMDGFKWEPGATLNNASGRVLEWYESALECQDDMGSVMKDTPFWLFDKLKKAVTKKGRLGPQMMRVVEQKLSEIVDDPQLNLPRQHGMSKRQVEEMRGVSPSTLSEEVYRLVLHWLGTQGHQNKLQIIIRDDEDFGGMGKRTRSSNPTVNVVMETDSPKLVNVVVGGQGAAKYQGKGGGGGNLPNFELLCSKCGMFCKKAATDECRIVKGEKVMAEEILNLQYAIHKPPNGGPWKLNNTMCDKLGRYFFPKMGMTVDQGKEFKVELGKLVSKRFEAGGGKVMVNAVSNTSTANDRMTKELAKQAKQIIKLKKEAKSRKALLDADAEESDDEGSSDEEC